MAKRLNLRNRYCPKCEGKIGIVRRATATEPFQLLGCVGGTHVLVDGCYGWHADDFPKKRKPPTKQAVDKFITTIRYPKFAAFAVPKIAKKFGMTNEDAALAFKNRTVANG